MLSVLFLASPTECKAGHFGPNGKGGWFWKPCEECADGATSGIGSDTCEQLSNSCGNGMYNRSGTSSVDCAVCSVCALGWKLIKKCNADSNTICGPPDDDRMKSSWPEVVSMSGENAVEIIKNSRPDLRQVSVIPTGSMVPMDVRSDRVRVYVENNIVVSIPRVG
jgi:hypothetical protein